MQMRVVATKLERETIQEMFKDKNQQYLVRTKQGPGHIGCEEKCKLPLAGNTAVHILQLTGITLPLAPIFQNFWINLKLFSLFVLKSIPENCHPFLKHMY